VRSSLSKGSTTPEPRRAERVIVATAADERRHQPADAFHYVESWYFDFSRADGTGGFVLLALVPTRRVAWYWAFLVSPEFGLVSVRDHEVPLPRGNALEVRADSLWAELVCETPMEHWGLGLEAFGVRLDDPADAYHGELGERLAVGLDLEWEAVTPKYDYPYPGDTGAHYEHAGIVHGELLVGDARVPFLGRGERDHSWGERDWWARAWHWSAFQLDDRFALNFVQSEGIGDGAFGSIWRPGEELEPVTAARVETHLGPEAIPTAARFVLNHELEVDVEVLAAAPVTLEGADGRTGRLPRALCRFTSAEGTGTGWSEWNQPPTS